MVLSMPPRKRAKTIAAMPDRTMLVAANEADKTIRRTLRGRRGGLKDMPNMPLDILLEIFAWMHPRDLLNLARTNKTFRAYLMSSASQTLWKTSMKRVEGLPQCPTYLSEPAYINLVFFPHCHVCLRGNIQSALFQFSARYCPTCRQKQVLPLDSVVSMLQKRKIEINKAIEIFTWVSDRTVSDAPVFLKSDLQRFTSRWDALEDDTSRSAFVDECVAKTRLIRQAMQEYKAWKDEEKVRRAVELRTIRSDRINYIVARLREEGWSYDLDRLSPASLGGLKLTKFASKAEVLTERGWLKIRGDAIAFMERCKARRLDAERRQALRPHFEQFAKAYEAYRPPASKRCADSDLEPHVMDFAVMEEFRAILDVPEGSDLSLLSDEQAMRALFDAAIPKWKQARKDELTALITTSRSVPEGIDPLTLVGARFTCRRCHRIDLQYPAVVAHVCARSVHPFNELYQDAVKLFWCPRGNRSPWSAKYLSPSEDAVSLLGPIIQTCGLDIECATNSDLAQSETHLLCRACPGARFLSLAQNTRWTELGVYDVDGALTHWISRHSAMRSEHEWEPITGRELAVVMEVEKNHLACSSSAEFSRALHGCHHCPYASSLSEMMQHVRRRHNITADKDDIRSHCYLHHDARSGLPRLVLERHDDATVKAKFRYPSMPSGSLNSMGGCDFGWDSD